MAVCGLFLHHGSTESRETLEQKFIFQIGTLNPNGSEREYSKSALGSVYYLDFKLRTGAPADTDVKRKILTISPLIASQRVDALSIIDAGVFLSKKLKNNRFKRLH